MLIKSSQIITVRTLLVKYRIMSGFIASTTVILTVNTSIIMEERKYSRIQNWRLYKMMTLFKVKKIGTIIWIGTPSYFKRFQSHWYDSETRKLGQVRAEPKGCWAVFVCFWTVASKAKMERIYTWHCDWGQEMGPSRYSKAQKFMEIPQSFIHVDGRT